MGSVSRLLRGLVLFGLVGSIAYVGSPDLLSQDTKPKQSKAKTLTKSKPEGISNIGPRPKKAPLAKSVLPITFQKNERLALVGSSTAERMNLFGQFETMLHLDFPVKELVVRNFARPADEVGNRQRSADYTRIDDPLYVFNPDTFFCFFGFNESFAGPQGIEAYKAAYERFIDEYTSKYPRDDEKSPPRFVLVSPIAFEATGDPLLPDGQTENANLKLYTEATKAVAMKRGLAFVDVFTPTEKAFTEKKGMQFTINGAHLNEAGDQLLGEILEREILGVAKDTRSGPGATEYEALRAAIIDKSWIHSQDYRMVNGWYVYGGRRTFDTETFPLEYAKIRAMAKVRDQYIWDLAAKRKVPAKPDDSQTGQLFVPPTRFGAPGQKYSEAEKLRYLTPEEFIKGTKVPEGFEIKLFADETKFPEIAKPVQLNFDNKGRLWVSCMPSYPQWKPGDPKANDKLVILEDTDGDGKADKSTVFYDQLQCPTGFEFVNGGVLVMDQPRMLFLKDTDGDDKADVVVHLMDGWATDDTHHTCGAFEWNHGGLLHMLEGIATSTTLETPWGPHRSNGAGGAYVMDPKTLKIRQFSLPGQYNMWCYVFDEWGQGIAGDGTTANHHWDTPLSGAQFGGRKGLNTIFNQEGMRPALGSEWLVSRHLPDHVQKQFTYAVVINMNGMPRFTVGDDGSGFKGERIKTGGKPDDLIKSDDKHFRPADPQIGPDGALWFGDWANALIGHMQYSQRDPSRDHVRGRVYRLVAKDRPLLKPATQFGKSVPEILEQLREYEWRTRYRARRELRDRPTPEVKAALDTWLAGLQKDDPAYDRLRTEALWILQSHHAIDAKLLEGVLSSKTPEARAAAVRILSDERDRFPEALSHFKKASLDSHGRVRLEAIRALSFYPSTDAATAVIAAAKLPQDYWLKYTIEHSLAANETAWRGEYLSGRVAKDDPATQKMLVDILASAKAGSAAIPFLRTLLSQEETSKETRNKAMTGLTMMKGNPSKGREVFVRSCIACHKVGNGDGAEYGPNLHQVSTRLKSKFKLVESVIDPNADVDKKYLSTKIATDDGKFIVGLVVAETKTDVTIFDGKEKKTILLSKIEERTQLKQSSMPEGMAGAMAPVEFLDLMEYLDSLR